MKIKAEKYGGLPIWQIYIDDEPFDFYDRETKNNPHGLDKEDVEMMVTNRLEKKEFDPTQVIT